MTRTATTLVDFVEELGVSDPISVAGNRTRWNLGGPLEPGCRVVQAPSGIITYEPAEMTVRVLAGTSVAELHEALAEKGQRTALPERGGTVGGALAAGQNHIEMLGRGRLRDSLLRVRYVSAEGKLVMGGGPTVKNVTGFDLPRLMVGSLGTLGSIAEVILRTNPIPSEVRWLRSEDADPFAVRTAVLAPAAVLWDGETTWVQLEGHLADVEAEQRALESLGRFEPAEGQPELPPERWSMTPAALRTAPDDHDRFVAVIGTGLLFANTERPIRSTSEPVRGVTERLRSLFDPTGRLNPGRRP